MTLAELAKVCRTCLKVMSAYNGKVLCFKYDNEKHTKYANREVLSVWADVTIADSGFENYARPIMCAYVEDLETYKKEHPTS